MTIILYISLALAFLGIVAAVASLIRNARLRRLLEKGEIDSIPEVTPVPPSECCGQHETCEHDSLYAAVSKKVEYYDDEDLDHYKGTLADEYSSDAEEEFRDVLYTLREDEVAGWLRSLYLREIELPEGLKSEALLIVGDRRH